MRVITLPASALLLLSLVSFGAKAQERICQDRPGVAALQGRISSRYVSLTNPRFSFMRPPVIPQEVRVWREALGRRGVSTREFTDQNVDNSFVFMVKRGSPAWRVRVSRVGPYVVMFRLSGPNNKSSELVDCSNLRPVEYEILRELGDQQFKLLDATALDFPSNLRKLRYPPDEYPQPINIWQALFSEVRNVQ
jgi:hypothetical protein